MDSLQIQIQNHPASIKCVIRLRGDLKSTDAINFKEQLSMHIDVFGSQTTVDLSEVDDLDLTGLNSLLISKQNFLRKGKNLRVRIPEDGPLAEFARITKFEKFLNIA